MPILVVPSPNLGRAFLLRNYGKSRWECYDQMLNPDLTHQNCRLDPQDPAWRLPRPDALLF